MLVPFSFSVTMRVSLTASTRGSMKKEESKRAFPILYSNWRRDNGLTSTPPGELDFYEFFSWVKQNHHEYTLFRSSTSVSDDFERWFDVETKQTWRN